uniref:Uncharacterized protein n=1 Tax=Panagrellus redivivus TaxID=6233 RepID=A0A7E5A0C1_PANRE
MSKTGQVPLQYCVYALWFINITIDFAQVFIIVERLWSSMYVRVYESLRNPFVMFVFVISPFALTSILQIILSVGLSLGLYIWLVIVLNMALWIHGGILIFAW